MEMFLFLLPPFVICVLMILMFGYLGMHVLKREIIFIDIALVQIAAVGSILAFVLWHAEEGSLTAYLTSFGCTGLAALFYACVGKHIRNIPHEAVIGVTYAIAAAAALFMLALAAGGDVHMEHMLTGSILWVKWTEIMICTGAFAFVGLFHYIFRGRFIRLSECMEESNHHEKSPVWDFWFYLSMGFVITLAVRLSGVLMIFSLLVMPATFSALFAESWRSRLRIAYIFALVATVAGLLFSYRFDFSCGPSVVSFLGAGLLAGIIFRKK